MTIKKQAKSTAEKKIFAHPIKKYETLLVKAEEFFKKVEAETEYKPLIIFLFVYLLVGQILEFVAWVPSLGATEIAFSFGATPLLLLSVLGGIFAGPALTILCSFIIAGAIHLGVSYYKKKQLYFSTWKVVGYAALIPIIYNVFATLITTIAESLNPWPEQSVFSQAPILGAYYTGMSVFLLVLGIAVLAHTVYTIIIGVKQYHNLTMQQASLAVIIPLLILFFLFIGAVMGIAILLRTSGMII